MLVKVMRHPGILAIAACSAILACTPDAKADCTYDVGSHSYICTGSAGIVDATDLVNQSTQQVIDSLSQIPDSVQTNAIDSILQSLPGTSLSPTPPEPPRPASLKPTSPR